MPHPQGYGRLYYHWARLHPGHAPLCHGAETTRSTTAFHLRTPALYRTALAAKAIFLPAGPDTKGGDALG
ncbi:hypothetical protein JOF48_001001 [Arthrobacter stackebrandtii]|uniref:Uncharacterized protein n=1 Tax=Arthrobacter stackebrandtii TaxID=272161 RepID=A0ABS4YTS9_9MICC|nr:hypothetical protein [Arthrobacter stackebrandtii]